MVIQKNQIVSWFLIFLYENVFKRHFYIAKKETERSFILLIHVSQSLKKNTKNFILKNSMTGNEIEVDAGLTTLLDKAKEYGRISALKAEIARNFSKIQTKNKHNFQRDSRAFEESTRKAIFEAKRAYEESLKAADLARQAGDEEGAAGIEKIAEERFSAARSKVLKSLYEMQNRAVELEAQAARAKAKVMKSVAKTVESAAKSHKDEVERVETDKKKAKKAKEAIEMYQKQHEKEKMVDELMKKSAFALDAVDAKRLSRAMDFTWNSYFNTLS